MSPKIRNLIVAPSALALLLAFPGAAWAPPKKMAPNVPDIKLNDIKLNNVNLRPGPIPLPGMADRAPNGPRLQRRTPDAANASTSSTSTSTPAAAPAVGPRLDRAGPADTNLGPPPPVNPATKPRPDADASTSSTSTNQPAAQQSEYANTGLVQKPQKPHVYDATDSPLDGGNSTQRPKLQRSGAQKQLNTEPVYSAPPVTGPQQTPASTNADYGPGPSARPPSAIQQIPDLTNPNNATPPATNRNYGSVPTKPPQSEQPIQKLPNFSNKPKE